MKSRGRWPVSLRHLGSAYSPCMTSVQGQKVKVTRSRDVSADKNSAVDGHIFVSRLHPCTTDSELIDSVNSVKGDLKVIDVKCNQLRSKYKDLYSSFHVAVTVNVECFKPAIELFSTAEAWPIGVFVKRYFKPCRDGSV